MKFAVQFYHYKDNRWLISASCFRSECFNEVYLFQRKAFYEKGRACVMIVMIELFQQSTLLRLLNDSGQCYTYELIKTAVELFKETGFFPPSRQ